MRTGDIFPSKFLKADDLKGRRVPVTIERVSMEAMDDENKAIVHFQRVSKGLVLNRTNAGAIALILGTDETDEWPGHTVQLYATPVMFQGKMTMAIRIEAAAAPTPMPAPVLRGPATVTPFEPGPFPPSTPPTRTPAGADADAFAFGANVPDGDSGPFPF